MRVLHNFILLLNSTLFFLISTCHWTDIILDDSIEIEIAKERERKNSYSYRDFKKFKGELKSLSFYRLSLVDDKSEEEEKRRRVWDNLPNRIQNKTFYKKSLAGDELSRYIRQRYESLSRYINYFETIYAKEETTIDDFLKKSNGRYADIYVFYGYVTGDLMGFKNKYGDLRKYYKDFDILVLKEGISKLARMIVFHSPLSYNDLEFLFEDADQYFEIRP